MKESSRTDSRISRSSNSPIFYRGIYVYFYREIEFSHSAIIIYQRCINI